MKEINCKKIRKLREGRGLRMKQVGEEVGLSANRYGRRERGEVEFTAGEFLQLVEVFDIPLCVLLDYVVEEKR